MHVCLGIISANMGHFNNTRKLYIRHEYQWLMTSLNRFRKPNSTQFPSSRKTGTNYRFPFSIPRSRETMSRHLTIKVVTPTVLDSVTPGEGGGGYGAHLIIAYTGRLLPKGEPFSGSRYIEGKGIH